MSTHTSVRFRLAIKDHRNNSELPAFCHSGKFILFLKLKYSVLRPNGARPTEAGRPASLWSCAFVAYMLVRNSRRRRKARPGIVRTASDERARHGPAHWWRNVYKLSEQTEWDCMRRAPRCSSSIKPCMIGLRVWDIKLICPAVQHAVWAYPSHQICRSRRVFSSRLGGISNHCMTGS